MTITQILYVLEVANCHTISRAAEKLYISQSALSQQILRLEAELGYPLFRRTPHGLDLTPAGEQFCRESAPVADAWNQLCSYVQNGHPHKKTDLRIGMGSRVYSNRLFQPILEFFNSYPEMEVTFVTEAGYDVLAALKDGTLDLALDRLPPEDQAQYGDDYFFCSLIKERQCILMAKEDPKAALSHITFQDLHGCTMMSGLEDSSEDRSLKSTCRKHNITLNRIFRSDGIETNMKLVRTGMGYVIGPHSFADYYQVSAVPLTPEIEVSLQFICLKSSIRRKEIKLFCDYLQKICFNATR